MKYFLISVLIFSVFPDVSIKESCQKNDPFYVQADRKGLTPPPPYGMPDCKKNRFFNDFAEKILLLNYFSPMCVLNWLETVLMHF